MPWRFRLGYSAIAIAIAYYVGAKVGLALTPQLQPVSTLWPPNAILLGALLLAPTKRWPILLAAAFVAHLGVELQGGVPLALVLCWFISNGAEAVFGAWVVRRYIERPVLFDSVRRVAVFVGGAALLAPFLASFLDVAFVKLIGYGAGGYWDVWRVRFLSNVLAILALVPAIVTWANAGFSALCFTVKQKVEGALLAISLLVACAVGFSNFFGVHSTPALLFVPLPILLWAALRFGPAWTSAALLVVALFSDWGAVHGSGPFADTVRQNILSFQIYLIFTYVPLMVLSAVLRERERDAEALREEAALRESAARLRELADAMPQIVFSAKPDGTIDYFNEKWWDLVQAEPGPITSETWLSAIHPEDRDACYRLWYTNTSMGRPHDHEARFRCTSDGEYHWHLVRALPVYDENGDIIRWYGTATDIDEQKNTESALRQSEAKLKQLRAQLENRVAERTTELSLANSTLREEIETRARAEQALRTLERQLTHMGRVAVLGELSAALAHELNQPLTAILANARAAQRILLRDNANLTEIRAILDDIVTDDLRAGSVIRRVRALIRKGDSDLQPVMPNDIVSEVLDLAHSDLILREVSVTTRLAATLPAVPADRIQLQQVILNLIVNACDAMSGNAPSDRQIIITTNDEGSAVRVSVSDRGTGISDDSVFEPFVTSKEHGLGLGLAICRSIIDAHGGRMWAVNNAERGATFHVLLPRLREAPRMPRLGMSTPVGAEAR